VSGNSIDDNSVSKNGGGIWAQDCTVGSNTASGNSASDDGGGIYASGGSVSNNIISGNSASVDGGGIYASASAVSNNTVSDNSASDDGGGIYASGSTVSGNTVSGNSASDNGGGIAALSNSPVLGNTVSGNVASGDGGGITTDSPVLINTVISNTASGYGAGVNFAGSNDFFGNYVVSNTTSSGNGGGVAINGTPQVHYNNFFANEPYDVEVYSSSDISGTLNYWGTTESVEILGQIYDWYDDSNRGRFLYMPFLSELYIPPPFGLTADFHDNSIDLSWDSHPYVIAGWGYNLYYDNDASGPPYDGTGAAGGDSPIDVGDATIYTLSSLASDENYFIALTVYDPEGRESDYSTEVHHDFGVSATPYSRQTPYGSSVTYTVMLTTTTGFNTPVDLGVIGLLDSATAIFEPPSVRPEGSATLTVTVPATATTTTYPLGVVASKSGITHMATVWLTVEEAPPLSISGLSTPEVPANAPTDIDIYGEGFLPVPTVAVGVTSCLNVTWLSSTLITATVPAGLPGGTYDVTVENPDGKSYTLYDALTVASPVLLDWTIYLPLALRSH